MTLVTDFTSIRSSFNQANYFKFVSHNDDAMFCCDQDKQTASDEGFTVLGSFLIF
jgi:hypothetical protein